MDRSEQRRIVEALVLGSPEPISAARLAEIVPGCKPGAAKDLINELNTEYQEQDRAFEIWEVAGGYQIRTRAEFSGYLQQLQKQRPLRLSRAALDTLSIIAYKQPVTRAEIEDIRGVDAGAVLKSLLDRRLIRIAGHREVPGRPMLYATNRRFLEVFGLESIKALPTLRELKELADQKGVALPGVSEAGTDDEAPEQLPLDSAVEGAVAPGVPEEASAVEEPAAGEVDPDWQPPEIVEPPPDEARLPEEPLEEPAEAAGAEPDASEGDGPTPDPDVPTDKA
jgi:segregation and condensation protein B